MSIVGVVHLHLFEEKISEQSVTKHTVYLFVTRDISFQSDFALLGKRYRSAVANLVIQANYVFRFALGFV